MDWHIAWRTWWTVPPRLLLMGCATTGRDALWNRRSPKVGRVATDEGFGLAGRRQSRPSAGPMLERGAYVRAVLHRKSIDRIGRGQSVARLAIGRARAKRWSLEDPHGHRGRSQPLSIGVIKRSLWMDRDD